MPTNAAPHPRPSPNAGRVAGSNSPHHTRPPMTMMTARPNPFPRGGVVPRRLRNPPRPPPAIQLLQMRLNPSSSPVTGRPPAHPGRREGASAKKNAAPLACCSLLLPPPPRRPPPSIAEPSATAVAISPLAVPVPVMRVTESSGFEPPGGSQAIELGPVGVARLRALRGGARGEGASTHQRLATLRERANAGLDLPLILPRML